MIEEVEATRRDDSCEITKLPRNHKTNGLKWVLKIKNIKGDILKPKVRVFAKGYVQQKEINFEEVFAHVARLETKKIILASVGHRVQQVLYMDVELAFLNGELQEEVYVLHHFGFIDNGYEDKLLNLRKVLYGQNKLWELEIQSLTYICRNKDSKGAF